MGDAKVGKEAEEQIRRWLDRPEDGYSFDRIPDQMTGRYGSSNICDFTCFKSPYMWYIESKATWEDRFDFTMITATQREGLLKKSQIANVFGVVIVLFASYQRAFMLNIQDICSMIQQGHMSLNIKKIDKWSISFIELETIPNSRRKHLDYTGHIMPLK